MDDEKLIEFVRLHPEIYDPSHKKYMDINVKTKVWFEIGQELGVRSASCKSRWFNIRDNFRKRIQKNATQGAHSRKPSKPYKYHEQLTFLIKYLSDRNNADYVDDKGETSYDQSVKESSPVEAMVSPISDSQFESDTCSTRLANRSPTSQKLSSFTDQSTSTLPKNHGSKGRNNFTDSLRTGSATMDFLIRQNKHPVDIFLASLAPTLKELHPCDLFEAKSEIYAIVQKYESKLLKQKFPRQHRVSTNTKQQKEHTPDPLGDADRSTSSIKLETQIDMDY